MNAQTYDELWKYLFPILYQKLKSAPVQKLQGFDAEEEAKDLAQQAIITAMEYEPDDLRAYARTVAVNLYNHWYRKHFPKQESLDPEFSPMSIQSGRRGEIFIDEESAEQISDSAEISGGESAIAEVKGRAEQTDHWQVVYQVLSQLTPRLRMVMSIYFDLVHQLKNDPPWAKENMNVLIAKEMEARTGESTSPGAIGVDRVRGLAALRQIIRQDYPDIGLYATLFILIITGALSA